jgi:hypothetical protein
MLWRYKNKQIIIIKLLYIIQAICVDWYKTIMINIQKVVNKARTAGVFIDTKPARQHQVLTEQSSNYWLVGLNICWYVF